MSPKIEGNWVPRKLISSLRLFIASTLQIKNHFAKKNDSVWCIGISVYTYKYIHSSDPSKTKQQKTFHMGNIIHKLVTL